MAGSASDENAHVLLLVSDWAEKTVVRVRSAEDADAGEEVGALDGCQEKNAPTVRDLHH